jgi:single-strand DNA-binding protein
MIKIEFTGKAGKDATLKQIDSSTSVINFSIAVDESYKQKDGEKVEKTKWIECEIWNRPKLQPHILKGHSFYINGNPDVKAYTPKDSTEAKGTLICRVDEIEFLTPKKEG